MNLRQMREVYCICRGNVSLFHTTMCRLLKKDLSTINKSSLYWKAKTKIEEMNKLKKNVRKRSAYKELCDSQFVLPLRIYNPSEQESCDESSDESSDEIKSVNSENEDLKAKFSNARQEIYKLSATVKRQTTTILRLTDKIDKLKKKLLLIKVTKDKANQCNLLKQQTNELLCQLEDLSLEVEDLKKNSENQTDNNNNTGTPQIINFKMKNCRGSPYSAKLRELCYIFRSRNISLEHVSPVIRSVLSMVDIHVENLPSLSTISNFTSELGLVSRIQMEEVLEKNKNLTMHRDATTKKGKHYYGVEFSTGEETLTAGIREVSDGKGETYASCTKEILSDISATNSSKILNNVSNFMTDRSSTEQKVNRILSEEIESNSDVNSFKCAVHPLLQFSEVCQKEILSIEKENSEKMDTSVKNDSNTLSLLKCVSKLFYKDGTGDPLLASTYVKKEIRISKIPIMNFRGTRFNTLFYNAAGTFFLKDQILGYLLSSKSSLNFIQNFILQSLQNDVVLAIIRALGIICKIVTEPYMKVAESSSLSAIDMGDYYNRLSEVLTIGIDSPEKFLDGSVSFIIGPCQNPSEKNHQEVAFSLYLASESLDSNTRIFISRFCSVLKTKSCHLFKDFFEAGKFFKETSETIPSAKTCPNNNICVERLMAKLDSNISKSPTCNSNTIESIVMYSNNKTSEWLKSKSEKEKINIITTAMKKNKVHLKTAKQRKKSLISKTEKILRDKQDEVKKRKEKKEKQIQIANQVQLWADEEEIMSELQKLPCKKQKLSALKNQFSTLKTLHQISAADRHLLNFSSKGKQFSIETLVNNLAYLLQLYNPPANGNFLSTLSCLCNGQKFKHVWSSEGEEEIWIGKIISVENNFYEVKYLVDGDELTDSCFLSKEELEEDFRMGNLMLADEPDPD